MCVRKLVLAVACMLPLAAAQACGPFFPQGLLDDRKSSLLDLPEGTFYYETGRLLPAPGDKLRAVEGSPWDDRAEVRAKAEAVGLTDVEVGKIKAMRAAGDPDAAAKAGAGLAPELLEYTLGAIAFGKGQLDVAATHFRAVLALSPPQRERRGLWAQYMLGRTLLASGDTAGADAAYDVVRERALSGIPDPLGLAVASLGEKARIAWHHGAVTAAIHLYAQQAAHGSTSAAASLLFVVRSLLAHRDQLDQALADPLGQRLLAAYLYTRSIEFEQNWPRAGTVTDAQGDDAPASATAGQTPPVAGIDVKTFLQIVEAQHLDHFDGADRLAAGAYGAGRYDLAGRFAARSDSALAAWVRAKLALRAGDEATAMREYAKAAQGFPTTEQWSEAFPYEDDLGHPRCRVEDERGILALSRGDYVEAMARMYAGASEYWADTAYVAERVLSVDELKGFVDAHVPAVAVRPATSGDASSADATADDATADDNDQATTSPAQQLRNLLARRLMRVGRLQDAMAYFSDPADRKQAQALLAAHRDDHAFSATARAKALFAQAQIIRKHGMELLGTELVPDNAWAGGAYGGDDLPKLQGKPFVGAGEAARVQASVAQPDARYHYRYLAANLTEQAATLVPARSQAYAAMMCSATGWMLDTDPASAQRIYHRYLRNGAYVAWGAQFGQHCPVPDFESARWLPYRQAWWGTRHFVRRQWPWLLGGVFIVGLAGAGWARRRRTA